MKLIIFYLFVLSIAYLKAEKLTEGETAYRKTKKNVSWLQNFAFYVVLPVTLSPPCLLGILNCVYNVEITEKMMLWIKRSHYTSIGLNTFVNIVIGFAAIGNKELIKDAFGEPMGGSHAGWMVTTLISAVIGVLAVRFNELVFSLIHGFMVAASAAAIAPKVISYTSLVFLGNANVFISAVFSTILVVKLYRKYTVANVQIDPRTIPHVPTRKEEDDLEI